LLVLAVLGAEARPLGGGDGWAVSGEGPLPGGGVFIVETLRRLYLQQLGGPGASCQTNSPNNGCMARGFAAVLVILMVIMVFLAISGAARPLSGEVWSPAGEETVSGDGVVQFLRQMYLQQLGAGPSCGTNSSNGGCLTKFVVAVVLTATIMSFLVTSSSARPLGGGGLGAGDAVVSGKHILQLLRQLYLQQLGASPSCQTNSSNGGCPQPPSG
ncbi:hypothetical protein BAE44_0018931, partial [Dichanthelium oligosanthes]